MRGLGEATPEEPQKSFERDLMGAPGQRQGTFNANLDIFAQTTDQIVLILLGLGLLRPARGQLDRVTYLGR